jgi:hypothetical protein
MLARAAPSMIKRDAVYSSFILLIVRRIVYGVDLH